MHILALKNSNILQLNLPSLLRNILTTYLSFFSINFQTKLSSLMFMECSAKQHWWSATIVCKIKTDAVVVFKDSIHFSFNHKKGVSLHWRRHVVRTKSCCKCSCFFAPYIHNISLHTVNVWCILTMCFMSGNK